MTRQAWIGLATLGSALLLGGAFVFQAMGYAPCPMCLWQRYPHAIAIVIGAIAFALPGRVLPAVGALAALTTAGIGIFHTGVERGWWEGPSTCTSGPVDGLTPQELMDQILAAPLVQCDQVAWEMLGLSMASWNAAISFTFVAFWLFAARQTSKD